MTFKKWHSIENHYRQKHIDFYLEAHPELADETYVILEKLHGSNFQWYFQPGEPVRAGSRNSYLDTTGSFQGASISDLMVDNSALFSIMRAWAEDADFPIRLFGELIGKGIGKGVSYGDKKRILYFAVMVNDLLLPFELLEEALEHHESKIVPVLARVKGLQNALSFDTEIDSVILGIPDNICEGVVIQPYSKVYYDVYGTSPLILKKKNEKFKEKQRVKKVHVVDSEVERLNAEFTLYVTDNRLQSVFSKHGEIDTPSQIGEYIKLVLADAKEDFLKDFGEDVDVLDKAQQKQVFNLGSVIANMLKGYL